MEEYKQALKELMDTWNRIIAALRKQFPEADGEEIYQRACQAMNQAIGLETGKSRET